MAERIIDGELVIVDEEFADLIDRFPWRIAPNGYVYVTMYLHRLITGAPPGKHVDHRDRNKRNNKRSNLAVVSPSENMRNRKYRGRSRRKRGSKSGSKFVGVFKRGRRWQAHVQGDYIGSFGDEVEAARAYNTEAVLRFGPGTYQNAI